jgi:hypothetical protein
MTFRRKVLLIAAVILAGVAVVILFQRRGSRNPPPAPEGGLSPFQEGTASAETAELASTTANEAHGGRSPRKIKHKLSEFSADQKSGFVSNFEGKYRPAIARWCKAYEGHIPFTADSITPTNFVESIGRDASYSEYIFVVNGITLGVSESGDSVRVDYLNNPKQTQKTMDLPDGSQPPSIQLPVTKPEIVKMLKADTGREFADREVRVTPSGISGNLNGGAFVEVGGDENNFASWKYNLIFGPDGELGYYLKGPD